MKPNSSPPRPKKPSGFRYKPGYGIVVICQDEKDQRRKFSALQKFDWKLKVVVV